MVGNVGEHDLYETLPVSERRRLQLFCVLLRKLREVSSPEAAAQRLIQKARMFMTHTACGLTSDQLQQWVLEWMWLHDCGQPFRLQWPDRIGSSIRLLTICLASGRIPPVEAWPWLAGPVVSAEMAPYWPRVWAQAIEALLATADVHAHVTRIAPICLLAGTPAAEIRDLPVIDWDHSSVQVLFRQVYKTARKANGHQISQLEQEWWQQITAAFPGSRPVRHYRLPGSRMHLDIYWPSRRVGLEIQGTQHWQPVERFGGTASFARRQETDAVKRAVCRSNGIHLVEVTQDTPVSSALSLLSGLVFSTSGRTAHRAP